MKKHIVLYSLMLFLLMTSCRAAQTSGPVSFEPGYWKPGKVSRVKPVPEEEILKPVLSKPPVVVVVKPHKPVPPKKPPVVAQKPKEKPVEKPEPDKGIYYTGYGVVLTYHHISREPMSGITITPERFKEDLEMLKSSKFNVISMRSLLNAMEGKEKLPPNAVVITFDDGIESFYKYAYPELKNYNMPAVNYIITYRNENYSPSTSDFNPLSPAEIKEMYKSGLVDIQSHTHNQHRLIYIDENLHDGGALAFRIYDKDKGIFETQEEYEKRVYEDLITSREVILKYTGQNSDMLCFPFGYYNDKVIELGRKAGFKYFITVKNGVNRENSKSTIILRIRAGETWLNTQKLKDSILSHVRERGLNDI